MEQIVVYASSPSPCDLASDYTMAARTLPRVLACSSKCGAWIDEIGAGRIPPAGAPGPGHPACFFAARPCSMHPPPPISIMHL